MARAEALLVVGMLSCIAFVVISFLLRSQSEETQVLVSSDRLVRTADDDPSPQ